MLLCEYVLSQVMDYLAEIENVFLSSIYKVINTLS